MASDADMGAMTTHSSPTPTTTDYTAKLYRLVCLIAAACLLALGVLWWNHQQAESRRVSDCIVAESRHRMVFAPGDAVAPCR